MTYYQKTTKMLGIGILMLFQYSCSSGRTPSEFLNKTTVSADIYNANKRVLTDSIREFILTNQSAYYPVDNDSLTEIFIDTILYSPSKDKIAFFVITKNTSNKLLSYKQGDKVYNYYDANCFIAHLKNDTTIDKISWIEAYGLINYKNQCEASKDIRELSFTENVRPNRNLRYNLDDVRFWNSKIWGDNK